MKSRIKFKKKPVGRTRGGIKVMMSLMTLVVFSICIIPFQGAYADRINIEANKQEVIRNRYIDVKYTYWGRDAIEEMSKQGYFSGYPDGTFRPDNDVSYNEFVKTIVCMMVKNNIKPIEGGDWASGYIKKAEEMNLIHKHEYNSEKFTEPIPRRYMALILDRVIKKSGIIVPMNRYMEFKSKIRDLKPGDLNEYEIVQAFASGIIKGNEKGEFNPENTMTRAESAQVLKRLVEMEKSKNVGTEDTIIEYPNEDGATYSKDSFKEYPFQPVTEMKSFGRQFTEEESIAIRTRVKPDKYVILNYDPRMRFRCTKALDGSPLLEVAGKRYITLFTDMKVDYRAMSGQYYSHKRDVTELFLRRDIKKVDYIGFSSSRRPTHFTLVKNPFKE